MKKTLIFSITLFVLASCGNSGYQPITRNNNNSSPATTTTGSDPAAAFTTIWLSEGTPISTSQEKRGIANFFGYNTTHYTNQLLGCYYGYTDETSQTPYTGANCFLSNDYLRNYFTAANMLVFPGPAPKDLGTVTDYKIRFAANLDNARDLVAGNAYLQVTAYSSSETLSREFTVMKSPMQVVSSTCGTPAVPCVKITASFKNDCGGAILHAIYYPGSSGILTSVYVTFKQDKASYKKGICYSDGHLPTGVVMSNDITDTLPSGIAASPDAGNGMLFVGGVVDLLEQ